MKGERIVMVPWAPRPLIVPEDGQGPPGSLDQFVDELIEEDLDTEPRWLDVALLAGGAGLVAGAAAGANSANVAFAGAVAVLLACGSLVRAAWRRFERRRSRGRNAGSTHGLPLVASHPDTKALITAYEQLLAVASLPGIGALGQEAAIAAHLAMIETATVLDGKPPSSVAEKEYVWQRARAVEALRATLERDRQILDAAPAME